MRAATGRFSAFARGRRRTRLAGARSSSGVRLITSDACIGLAESTAEFFPEAAWQRCIVGSLKKSPAADSVLVNDSLLTGAGYARAQGAGSTGALHHGVAQAAHSG